MARRSVIRLLFVLVAVAAFAVSTGANDVERLARLARTWAAVKYLHPWLSLKDIDWDAALVQAIPKVRAATTDDEFAGAVGSMLSALNDPATRVLRDEVTSPTISEATLFRWAGDVLVINAGPYAQAKSGMALLAELSSIVKEIRKARPVCRLTAPGVRPAYGRSAASGRPRAMPQRSHSTADRSLSTRATAARSSTKTFNSRASAARNCGSSAATATQPSRVG
jgi:hypothetical protein